MKLRTNKTIQLITMENEIKYFCYDCYLDEKSDKIPVIKESKNAKEYSLKHNHHRIAVIKNGSQTNAIWNI